MTSQGKDVPEASQLQRLSQDFHTRLGAPRPPPKHLPTPEELWADSNWVLGSRAEAATGKKSLCPRASHLQSPRILTPTSHTSGREENRDF